MKSNEEVMRLAEAVRNQRSILRALLEHPDRDPDNFHFQMAGVLRSMLCDSQWPTLVRFAQEFSVSLRVWGPYPPAAIDKSPPDFSFNALVASTQPVLGGYEMSIEEYLGAPIGAIAVPVGKTMKPTWYTPQQIIKWTANKEGPAHFDPNLPATYQGVGSAWKVVGSVTMHGPQGSTQIKKNDNIQLRIALIQIAQWSIVAADEVLAKFEQANAGQ